MSYCVNCGSEVANEAKLCKDCGYDPNIRGKRIRPDLSTIEGYDAVITEAAKASEKSEIVCPGCFKSYGRSMDSCPNCSEKNSQKCIPAPANSQAKKYAAFTALALLAIIVALSMVHGL
jgi:predicted amidophosphoribosyltransferase